MIGRTISHNWALKRHSEGARGVVKKAEEIVLRPNGVLNYLAGGAHSGPRFSHRSAIHESGNPLNKRTIPLRKDHSRHPGRRERFFQEDFARMGGFLCLRIMMELLFG
jgi:hypothetical protein